MRTYIKPERAITDRVIAVSTTRNGGVSREPYESFNVAFHVGDKASCVVHNRTHLAQDFTLINIQWLEQVHGCEFIEASSNSSRSAITADAAWTRVPGLAIAIMTADCLPVLLASTDKSVRLVAGAHCGWKGLQSGLLKRLINALPCAANNLSVWLPPAISQANYEVDNSVVDSFPESIVSDEKCVQASEKTGHYLFSLGAIAEVQLQELGVTDVQATKLCVNEDERFYSYRRNPVTGRMASLIWLEA